MSADTQTKAGHVRFVRRIAPRAEQLEDAASGRLVTRFQAGDREAFAALYESYFDRVFTYLRLLLRDRHEAEDAAQQVFTQIFQALPRYEPRQPFRAWLFASVRNYANHHLRKHGRVDAMDPAELSRRYEHANGDEVPPPALSWISDEDIVLFVERLPLPQRQVLTLRYMLGMRATEVATVLDRSPGEVRVLQHRALGYLRDRLSAIGRGPDACDKRRARTYVRQAPVLRARRYALKS